MSRKRRRRNARPKQAASEHNGSEVSASEHSCSSGRTTENFGVRRLVVSLGVKDSKNLTPNSLAQPSLGLSVFFLSFYTGKNFEPALAQHWARDWRALALTQVHHGSRLSDSKEFYNQTPSQDGTRIVPSGGLLFTFRQIGDNTAEP